MNLKVCFFGDSITDIGAPYGVGPTAVTVDHSWTEHVKTRLVADYPYANFTFVNTAHSGYTWELFASELASRVTSHAADVYVYMLGINDSATTTLANMSARMATVLDAIDGLTGTNSGKKPSVVACSLVRLDEGKQTNGGTNAKSSLYSDAVKSAATARGYRVADFWAAYAALQTSPPSWTAVHPYFPLDGVHPGPLGHDLMADTAYPYVSAAVAGLLVSTYTNYAALAALEAPAVATYTDYDARAAVARVGTYTDFSAMAALSIKPPYVAKPRPGVVLPPSPWKKAPTVATPVTRVIARPKTVWSKGG